MNDMIEKLKKNKMAFVLFEPEEQKLLKSLPENTIECLLDKPMEQWNLMFQPNFNRLNTYRIKSDYKPEPEPVDLEITESAINYLLGVERTDKSEFLPYNFNHLHLLPSLPNFAGFYHTGGDKQTEVQPEWVARYFPNVIARFEVK